MVKRWSWS